MEQIIVEHIMRDIFNQIPDININADLSKSIYFGWGNKKELNKQLVTLLKDEDNVVYPLIWLLPSKDNYKDNGLTVTKECSIIVATRETREELLNDQRWQASFQYVLNPTSNYVIEGLRTSGASRILEGEWSIERFSDFSDDEEESREDDKHTIDLWDAIKIEASVEFTNNCLKTITWQTKQ